MEITRRDQIVERFAAFHQANPQIWHLFKKFAIQAANSREHYSARTIIHRVRWHVDVETKDTDGLGIKINNDFSPYYARMFELAYPENTGLFERRKLKSAERSAYANEPLVFRNNAGDEESLKELLRSLLLECSNEAG